MKYIKQGPFLSRKGTVVKFPFQEEGVLIEKEISISEVLELVVNAYVPLQTFHLNNAQLRKKEKILDVIDKKHPDYMPFEDEDFLVLKQLVEQVTPMVPMLASYTPRIEDVLNAALIELPKE